MGEKGARETDVEGEKEMWSDLRKNKRDECERREILIKTSKVGRGLPSCPLSIISVSHSRALFAVSVQLRVKITTEKENGMDKYICNDRNITLFVH